MERTGTRVAINRQQKLAWLLLASAGLASVLLGRWLLLGGAGARADVLGPAWWLFLVGAFLFLRRDGSVAADERDRAIQAQGARAGYAALALMLMVASVLAEEHADFVAARGGAWLGSFLAWLVCLSLSVHAAVMLWHYRYGCR